MVSIADDIYTHVILGAWPTRNFYSLKQTFLQMLVHYYYDGFIYYASKANFKVSDLLIIQ